jgi:WD40 repeat protein
MRDGKYIICPSSESSVVIFKRDNIETYCDRIQGIPGSVDCLLKLNDNTFLTGSEDGFVRGLSFKPNKIVQTIGQHEEDENFPIESLSLSHCGNIVASTSHDNSIKFYDVSEFVKKRLNDSSQVKEED